MFSDATSEILKKFKLRQALIYFLNNNNFYQTIEKEIYVFANLCKKKQKYTTIHINLKVDFCLTSDFSSEIAVELISDPIKFNSEVREIVHLLLCTILETKDLQINQVFVTIIPTSVPVINEIHMQGLCSFQAVLTEHSKQQKYIFSTTWKCPNHKESPIFHKGLPTNDLRCDLCHGILQEMVSFRTTGEIVHGIFVSENSLQMNKPGNRYQATQVEIKDSNISKIELGAVYNITGVQLTNFIAWHCEKYVYSPIFFKQNDIFTKLSQYREKSPWMFVYALSMLLAVQKYPSCAYLNLKVGILLSLASLNEKSNPVPIFAFGVDSFTAHNLFLSASGYAKRFVCSTVKPILSAHKHNEFYEANPLILSKGGVCYLGDWEKYQKEKNAFIVRSALESNTINFEDFLLPLRSTIWSYWAKPTKTKNLTQLQTLVNVFGIPFICDPLENEENVIDFTISKNMNQKSKQDIFHLNDDKMKEFLLSVASINVTVAESAEKLLSDYFVASRKLRPACLPIRALEHMTSLAEAHARLNLRSEVVCEDVIAIVSLYEESMDIMFGTCTILPSYKKVINNIDEVDAEMNKFTSWFKEFLSII